MKNFVRGSAKAFNTKFGEVINVTLNVEDMKQLPIYNGYWKLSIAKRKEAGQYGDTHYVYENDYVGENKKD